MRSVVVKVEPQPEYRLKIVFLNGSFAMVDMSRRVRAIRFRKLEDRQLFASARVEGDMVVWEAKGERLTAYVNELLDSMQLY